MTGRAPGAGRTAAIFQKTHVMGAAEPFRDKEGESLPSGTVLTYGPLGRLEA